MRLLGLIDMLASGALTALGKIVDPSTGETAEVNLDQARLMIDLIESIQYKTKGNQTDRERQILELHLTNLRLTFVDEMNQQKKNGGAPARPGAEAQAAQAQPQAAPASKPSSSSEEPASGFVDKRSGR